MHSFQFSVSPVQHNSQCITLPEWVAIFTLCLAPLIAHIVSGTPQVSYTTRNRPKWYDRLCLYNPTSIIWRYAAITDRRIRATRWNRYDLAASNAILWTEKGWDGTEDMVVAAAPHCTRCPELMHAQIVSVTMLKTTITTLQGVSALHWLIGGLAGLKTFSFVDYMGLDMIFFPIAVLGLLRLCAAAWLTEDFEYAWRINNLSKGLPQRLENFTFNDRNVQLILDDALDPFLLRPFQPSARFRSPRSSWSSRVFRFLYLLVVGGVWAVSFVYFVPGVTPGSRVEEYTMTSFLVGLFYFLFLTISVIIYTFYFFRGQTTTTLLPCISRIWYRVYTMLVIGFMFVLIVVASIETNKMPNGQYATVPLGLNLECSQLRTFGIISPNDTFFGFASREERNTTRLGPTYSSIPVAKLSGNNVSLGEKYWLYGFNGYCIGAYEPIGT